MSANGRVASVLLASSEVVPFAKTGGLADVCGSLPPALARRGHRCAVILPLYRCAKEGGFGLNPTEHVLQVPLGGTTIPARLWRGTLPDSDVPAFLVEQPDFYERDDPARKWGIYVRPERDGRLADYPDNCERFAFFCRAVLEAAPHVGFTPDVIHANDWQTGLVPVYLRELYRTRPHLSRAASLFTIHNMAFQGVFPAEKLPVTGLGWHLFNIEQLEYYGHFSFLKGGIVFADWINTVSPTYAKEIQTKYFGLGLHGVLFARSHRLSGIVNGIDARVWNPADDPHLNGRRYDADSFETGKPLCKADLQRELGLAAEPRTPLLAVIARLTPQKGVHLILGAAERLIGLGAQLVVLGTGDKEFERQLPPLAERFPGRVAVRLEYDEGLAHRIEAGADIFLMPSEYEPCGLNQLYSLRYGTPPVVRATGGLVDTVTDATEENIRKGTATGFVFVPPSADALAEAAGRAVEMYRHRPEVFRQLIRTGMRQDWSWDRSAAGYEDLYLRLIAERDARAVGLHRGRPR
ncbi:MAG TPA: glycogen synthase GlgA [Gemmataceae bacterium]